MILGPNTSDKLESDALALLAQLGTDERSIVAQIENLNRQLLMTQGGKQSIEMLLSMNAVPEAGITQDESQDE